MEFRMAAKKGKRVAEITALDSAKAEAAVKDFKIDTVIGELGKAQLNIAAKFGDLVTELTTRSGVLNNLNVVIATREQRLKEVAEIEVAATTLAELEAQIAKVHEEWANEQAERDEEVQRSADEYTYDLALTRSRETDIWNDKVAQTKREETTRIALVNQDLEVRKAEMAAKETEFAALKKQAEGLPAQLKKTADEAALATKTELSKDHTAERNIWSLKEQHAKNLADSEKSALTKANEALIKQVQDLQTALEGARRDSKEIANAALAAGSQKELASSLSKVMEQGVTGSQKPKQ